MSDEDWQVEGRRQAESRLARLADLLGCQTEVFTDGVHAPRDVRQLREFIELWSAIDDPDDRDRLIALARELAGA